MKPVLRLPGFAGNNKYAFACHTHTFMLLKMPMNTIDLHMHSNHSDGSHSPYELVAMAKSRGLRTISITDHDTISQISESLQAAEALSFDVIAGVEVSAEYDGGTMHILGYGVDPDNDALFAMLQKFREGRDLRNPRIIEKLQELGVPIAYEEVLKEAAGASVGRPHIARVLVRKGVVSEMQEVFDTYLAKGAPAYVERFRFSSREIIDVIHQSGGVAFLAHPKLLRIDRAEVLHSLLQRLISEGLDGIEAYSQCHTKKEIHQYEKLAKQYRLAISGGSDFHGDGKPYVVMGSIGKDVVLDPVHVETLKAMIAERKKV